jgi:hypothetical protein
MESTTIHKVIALAGIAVLVVGVFVPIFKYPSDDEAYNYFDLDSENGIPADGPGVYILIVAVVSLLMIGMDRLEYLWLPAILVFWVLFQNFASIGSSILDRDTAGLREGWLFLFVGPILMTAPRWFHALRQNVLVPISNELEEAVQSELEEEQFDEQ